jgi:hypothetical protein
MNSACRSTVAANFVGWEKEQALFDRELEKVIRAMRTGEGGREKRWRKNTCYLVLAIRSKPFHAAGAAFARRAAFSRLT